MKRFVLISVGSVLVSLALLCTHPCSANNDPASRRSLAGLEAVAVEIPEMASELLERGITEDVILAEVQLQLRQAGIDMLDPERPRAKPVPGNPVLRVEVMANVHDIYDQASFSVQVSVLQDVELARYTKKKGTDRTLRAPTWSTGGIGESGTDWRDVLRGELAFFVGQFVDAWQEANPTTSR